MHKPENIILSVYHLTKDGLLLSGTRFETDFHTHQLISKTPIVNMVPKCEATDENFDLQTQVEVKLHLSRSNFITDDEPEDKPSIKLFKVPDSAANSSNESLEGYETTEQKPLSNIEVKKEYNILNVPTMIRCQNCETNFPTKYQYQRHQCEFNLEKVILKAHVDFEDTEKGSKIKYDCLTCGKQFVSRNNLERHAASHVTRKDNICEYCSKQFVSENRLRIHKENHCKKAGDISKFYRSDVAVWKCSKCNEVFSSIINASHHTEQCNETSCFPNGEETTNNNAPLQNNDKDENTRIGTKNYEKIVTEILFQCEFCNRTYIDINDLLKHQRKHTTEKNYNCTNCNEAFDSYATAAKHWLKKCSDNVSFFCLPKLTFCEYCKRTFKSHELLYTHKIKKKHYTLKIHNKDQINNERNTQSRGTGTSAENLDEMIIDVLQILQVSPKIEPLHHDMGAPATELNLETPAECNINDVTVKSEVLSESGGNEDNAQDFTQPEKKRRGRKRKYPKQVGKVEKLFATDMEGCKYQCERCIKVFDDVTDLESHRENEHAASFNCDECGKIFNSAKALLIHTRKDKNLKPHICDTCGRSYSQTSHLWQHMRFHQGIKPFACPHEGCEARYTIRPDLKDHIRKVHTRERPFKCTVCNKCFLTGSVYYQHRLIHTNDRRYGCDELYSHKAPWISFYCLCSSWPSIGLLQKIFQSRRLE